MPTFAAGGRPAFTLLVGVVLALVSLATGCASPAGKQKGKADAALLDFRRSLYAFDARIEASVRAIDRLQAPNTYDYERAYMDFVTEYFNVSADGGAVRDHAETMRDTSAGYFLLARDEAKGDPKSTETVARRQAASQAEYDVLQTRLGELHEQYAVYREQLKGIYKHLNRNVTRARIAGLQPQLDAARAQAPAVRSAIEATKSQADRLAAVAMTKQ